MAGFLKNYFYGIKRADTAYHGMIFGSGAFPISSYSPVNLQGSELQQLCR